MPRAAVAQLDDLRVMRSPAHRFGGCGRFCTPEAEKSGLRACFRGVWTSGKNASETRAAPDLRFLEKREDRGWTACTESGAVDEPGVHSPRFRARGPENAHGRARKRARRPENARGGARIAPRGLPRRAEQPPDPAHGGARAALGAPVPSRTVPPTPRTEAPGSQPSQFLASVNLVKGWGCLAASCGTWGNRYTSHLCKH